MIFFYKYQKHTQVVLEDRIEEINRQIFECVRRLEWANYMRNQLRLNESNPGNRKAISRLTERINEVEGEYRHLLAVLGDLYIQMERRAPEETDPDAGLSPECVSNFSPTILVQVKSAAGRM